MSAQDFKTNVSSGLKTKTDRKMRTIYIFCLQFQNKEKETDRIMKTIYIRVGQCLKVSTI